MASTYKIPPASDMVFNYGTGPESLESKIAASLQGPYRGPHIKTRDIEHIAGKIAFIIRYQLGGRIAATEVTIATIDILDRCAIKILVHMGPGQMKEVMSAIAGNAECAIVDLITLVNKAVDKVYPMEDAGVKKEPSLIEVLAGAMDNAEFTSPAAKSFSGT